MNEGRTPRLRNDVLAVRQAINDRAFRDIARRD